MKTAKNVVRLKDALRSDDTVRMARRVRALAEGGDIQHVAFVAVRHGGWVTTGWSTSLIAESHALHSGAQLLAARIQKALIDSTE